MAQRRWGWRSVVQPALPLPPVGLLRLLAAPPLCIDSSTHIHPESFPTPTGPHHTVLYFFSLLPLFALGARQQHLDGNAKARLYAAGVSSRRARRRVSSSLECGSCNYFAASGRAKAANDRASPPAHIASVSLFFPENNRIRLNLPF